VPSSFAFTIHRLQNAGAGDQHVVKVGVDRIGISSEHLKLDRAVAFGRFGVADG
jgi:hypothetical protein